MPITTSHSSVRVRKSNFVDAAVHTWSVGVSAAEIKVVGIVASELGRKEGRLCFSENRQTNPNSALSLPSLALCVGMIAAGQRQRQVIWIVLKATWNRFRTHFSTLRVKMWDTERGLRSVITKVNKVDSFWFTASESMFFGSPYRFEIKWSFTPYLVASG